MHNICRGVGTYVRRHLNSMWKVAAKLLRKACVLCSSCCSSSSSSSSSSSR